MHPIVMPLAVLFLASALYAALLSTRTGREFATAKTWVTVVVGTALVLGALALYDVRAAAVAALFFAAGGAPIVARSLLLEFQRERTLAERAMRGRE